MDLIQSDVLLLVMGLSVGSSLYINSQRFIPRRHAAVKRHCWLFAGYQNHFSSICFFGWHSTNGGLEVSMQLVTILVNIVISILVALFASPNLVAIWILIQFLNGRDWFSDMHALLDEMNFVSNTLRRWHSGATTFLLFLATFVAWIFSDRAGAVLLIMAVGHLIGWGWYKISTRG